MKEFKVCQEVCFVQIPIGRGELKVSMQPITRVGSKYFYIKPLGLEIKISKETLTQEGFSNYKSYCFMTMQEYLDDKEARELGESIAQLYRHYSRPKLSLDQLRRIKAIIDETNQTT